MRRAPLVLLSHLIAAGVVATAQSNVPVPVQPGEAFPPLSLQVLEPGATALVPLDLSRYIGKRPIVFVQFAVGNGASEEVLLAAQELAGGLGGDVAVLGAIRGDAATVVPEAAKRLPQRGVKLPVVLEHEADLVRSLGVSKLPAISLVDHQGILRIAGAGGLKQKVGTGIDMAQAIARAAARQPVPTAGDLEPYKPVDDLIGETFFDFKLEALGTGQETSLSQVVGKEKKVTALLFWHPDSKESFNIMSGVVSGAASYHKWINVVSVADLGNDDEVRRAEEFVKTNAMTFPVLRDQGRTIQDRYRVGSLATVFFIRPDGTIDSVYTGTNVNYVPVFSLKIRRILKVGKEYEGGASPS